jgi:hypothetical protein
VLPAPQACGSCAAQDYCCICPLCSGLLLHLSPVLRTTAASVPCAQDYCCICPLCSGLLLHLSPVLRTTAASVPCVQPCVCFDTVVVCVWGGVLWVLQQLYCCHRPPKPSEMSSV